MSIQELPSGAWRAQVYDPNRRCNVSVGVVLGGQSTFGSREEAVEARAQARAELRPDDAERWQTVYKLYDADRCLLYVGVTGTAMARFGLHSAHPRWRQVAYIEIEHVKGREAGYVRERELIRELDPPWNVRGKVDAHEGSA